MELRAVSTVLVQQAIVTGRVMDALTAERLPVPVGLTFELRESGTDTYRAFPNPGRFSGNGYFAFYGKPDRVFPSIDSSSSLECRLVARGEGYADAEDTFTLTAAQVTPTERTEVIAGREVRVKRLDAPVADRRMAMTPEPVSLAGMVIQDHDFESPIAGASVSVTAPEIRGPVLTDARGHFRIDNLPIAAVVTVQAQSGTNSLSVGHRVDYRARINDRTLSLSTEGD